jgi:hypothetical protein
LASNICKDAPSCSIGRDAIVCGCACVLWALAGAVTICLDTFQRTKQEIETVWFDEDMIHRIDAASKVAIQRMETIRHSNPTPNAQDATEQPPVATPRVKKRRTKQKSSAGKDPTTPFPSPEELMPEELNMAECD